MPSCRQQKKRHKAALELMVPRTDEQTAAANRAAFGLLLADLKLTRLQAADLIASTTMRPCSLRAVKSWLAAPTVVSARPCPTWAVEALRKGGARMRHSQCPPL